MVIASKVGHLLGPCWAVDFVLAKPASGDVDGSVEGVASSQAETQSRKSSARGKAAHPFPASRSPWAPAKTQRKRNCHPYPHSEAREASMTISLIRRATTRRVPPDAYRQR